MIDRIMKILEVAQNEGIYILTLSINEEMWRELQKELYPVECVNAVTLKGPKEVSVKVTPSY
jgi:hypothetical protein